MADLASLHAEAADASAESQAAREPGLDDSATLVTTLVADVGSASSEEDTPVDVSLSRPTSPQDIGAE